MVELLKFLPGTGRGTDRSRRRRLVEGALRPTESPLGMLLVDARGIGDRRIPTQILEAGLGATILAGAAGLAALHPPAGSVFATSLAVYAMGRLFLQPLRERQRRVAGVAAPRIASAALMMAAAAWMAVRIV